MYEVWGIAALWLGLALLATLLSIWLRIATALSEIIVGTVAQLLIGALIGTTLGSDQPWIKFLSGTGAIVLTFLAGAELDPVGLRHLRAGNVDEIDAHRLRRVGRGFTRADRRRVRFPPVITASYGHPGRRGGFRAAAHGAGGGRVGANRCTRPHDSRHRHRDRVGACRDPHAADRC